jgi:hypothetical protein
MVNLVRILCSSESWVAIRVVEIRLLKVVVTLNDVIIVDSRNLVQRLIDGYCGIRRGMMMNVPRLNKSLVIAEAVDVPVVLE